MLLNSLSHSPDICQLSLRLFAQSVLRAAINRLLPVTWRRRAEMDELTVKKATL